MPPAALPPLVAGSASAIRRALGRPCARNAADEQESRGSVLQETTGVGWGWCLVCFDAMRCDALWWWRPPVYIEVVCLVYARGQGTSEISQIRQWTSNSLKLSSLDP